MRVGDIVLVLGWWVWHGIWVTRGCTAATKQPLPGSEGLGGEDPASGRDPDAEDGDVFEQEGHKGWGIISSAILAGRNLLALPQVVQLPVTTTSHFVEEQDEEDDVEQHVETRVEADTHDQTADLPGLGHITLQLPTDVNKRREPDHKEDEPHQEIQGEREEHKDPQSDAVGVPRVAEPRELVPIHQPEGQHQDDLEGGQPPGYNVVEQPQLLHGLLPPFEGGSQEPCESQHDPPDGGGHVEEIEYHKEDDTASTLVRRLAVWQGLEDKATAPDPLLTVVVRAGKRLVVAAGEL